jgi:hypothetical protein
VGGKALRINYQPRKVRRIGFDSRSREFLNDANVFLRYLYVSIDNAERIDDPYWQRLYFIKGRRLIWELSTNLLDLTLYFKSSKNEIRPGS